MKESGVRVLVKKLTTVEAVGRGKRATFTAKRRLREDGLEFITIGPVGRPSKL
jgi:hypothetical protein